MIEYLHARGFRGHKDKLGLDEVEIDFRGREGLICFDGRNGLGKSTTLDLLQPFAMMPSRLGSGRDSELLLNNVILRDSFKKVAFTYNGHHYRIEIKIDSESGKQEGFVYVDHSSVSVINEKISQFYKWAEATFGSTDLLLASLFCTQNAKKMPDMRVGELRALFNEFLGDKLLRLERYAETSKNWSNFLSGKALSLDAKLAGLTDITRQRLQTIEYRNNARDKAETLMDNKTIIGHELIEKRQQSDALKETLQKNALALQRKADIATQIERLEADLAKEKEAATAEIKALQEKWQAIKKERSLADAILKDREAIEQAAKYVAEMEATLPALQAEIDRYEKDRAEGQDQAHKIEKEIEALKQQLKDLDNDPENIRLGKIIENAKRFVKEKTTEFDNLLRDAQYAKLRAEVAALEKAAFVGAGIDALCVSVTCAAIKSVNEATAQLPLTVEAREKRFLEISEARGGIEKEIQAKKEETAAILTEKGLRVSWIAEQEKAFIEQIKTLIHDLKNKQQIVIGNAGLITLKRQQQSTNKAAIAKGKELAAKVGEIQLAEARKADLEQQLQ